MNEHSFILSEVRQEIKEFLPSRGNSLLLASGLIAREQKKIAGYCEKYGLGGRTALILRVAKGVPVRSR